MEITSAKKLWQKTSKLDSKVEKFTVGNDKEWDLRIVKYDLEASTAHAKMLHAVNLLNAHELKELLNGFSKIERSVKNGEFRIDPDVEDVHSQIEILLVQYCGEVGKKIHMGRSRNDQVLVAMKLYLKNEILRLSRKASKLGELFIHKSELYKSAIIPGFTHFQVAMPSSVGLWLSAYAESLCDDMEFLLAAYHICDKNPLGSAAGFGSSFPLDREMTTSLLSFSEMNVNSVYAQMTRGKTERSCAIGIASLAATLSKFSYDVCLYMSQNYGFVSFPAEYTTGSSIMPHKKNPDVFELIRAKCNLLQSVPEQFNLLLNNLPSGYHRDFQLTKQLIFPAFDEINECMDMLAIMLEHIQVNVSAGLDHKYDSMYSVEVINSLIKSGYSFRDAYRKVGISFEEGSFIPARELHHTHLGSLGNLGNPIILKRLGRLSRLFKS